MLYIRTHASGIYEAPSVIIHLLTHMGRLPWAFKDHSQILIEQVARMFDAAYFNLTKYTIVELQRRRR